MADKKITELTAFTAPIDGDLVPLVDTTANETKKITWAYIKSNLKTYFDGVYAAVHSIFVTAVPEDHVSTGVKVVLTANENQAFGDVCYIDSDGEAHLGDADGIATASCVVMCADATIDAAASGNYLLHGVARDDSWDWTVGGLIYLSTTGTTGNTLTQIAPSGNNDVVQIIGVATHADRMYFNPQLVQVEILA